MAGWAVVAGLVLAALVAIVALVSGDFDDDDGRVALTSLGFSIFSGIGAPGAELYRRHAGGQRALGGLGVGLAVAGFILLVAALWIDDADEEGLWRTWGVVAVLALCAAHAALVLGARRGGDSPAVRGLGTASIGLALVDTTVAVLLIVGVADEFDEGWARALAVTVVLLVLTTALPPILRRLGRATPPPTGVPEALEAIAARLDSLGPTAAQEAVELRNIARRLRD